MKIVKIVADTIQFALLATKLRLAMNFIDNKKKFLFKRTNIIAFLGIFFTIVCFLLVFCKVIVNPQIIASLLFANIGLMVIACVFFFRRIKRIFKFSKKKYNGTRFHKQVAMLISSVTLLPAICVFVCSILFFNLGIENLFKSPIKNAMDNAEKVSSIYIDDIKFSMENFANGIAEQISSCINGMAIDEYKINEIFKEEITSIKIDAAVVQLVDNKNINVILNTQFSSFFQFEALPREIASLEEGEVTAWELNDLVFSAAAINKDLHIYLIISAPIDQTILNYKYKIKSAVSEYANLAVERSNLKFSFITVFSLVTIFLLFFSIIVGVVFTNQILRPINKLLKATRNIMAGDYNTPIQTKTSKNEWDVLISTFNEMMRKLERQKQQLIISQKQKVWRDIARKIAHEIKNPLTPIQLSAERLRDKYQKEITTQPEVFDACIDTITRQVNCISGLVKEFSEFARMPSPKFESVDIVKLLKNAVFMQSIVHKNISFHQNYNNDKLICEIDQNQINQVAVNILKNSVNAIVENKDNKSEEIIGNIIMDLNVKENVIHISVEDDGPGFSDASIERALEPYYTTRKTGTGLGLSVVHKIVTDHSGKISIGKSKRLGGAIVTISMPRFQNDKTSEIIYDV